MVDKLTVHFPEQGKYGDNPARQLNALERATRSALKQIQDWVNRYAGVTPRSPFVVVKWAGPAQFDSENCQVHVIEATEPFEFVMPRHRKDLLVIVKDGRGNASVNTITLKRQGGHGTFDGIAADYVINTDNGYAWFISDGDGEGDRQNWWSIARG